ncbi:MAG: cysteine hydrolase family protein [Pseudomonadota bacterium]
MANTALILIDIQRDYFDGGRMTLPGMVPAAQNAKRLLEDFRQRGAPLFHIRHINSSVQAAFFRPDSMGNETHPLVAPLPSEPVIIKNRPSAFVGTDLAQRLKAAGITRLIVCGAMSQMCVDATTRAAVDMGFEVTVVEDACAAANVSFGGVDVPAQKVHAAIMAPLAAAYAKVVVTADVVEPVPA